MVYSLGPWSVVDVGVVPFGGVATAVIVGEAVTVGRVPFPVVGVVSSVVGVVGEAPLPEGGVATPVGVGLTVVVVASTSWLLEGCTAARVVASMKDVAATTACEDRSSLVAEEGDTAAGGPVLEAACDVDSKLCEADVSSTPNWLVEEETCSIDVDSSTLGEGELVDWTTAVLMSGDGVGDGVVAGVEVSTADGSEAPDVALSVDVCVETVVVVCVERTLLSISEIETDCETTSETAWLDDSDSDNEGEGSMDAGEAVTELARNVVDVEARSPVVGVTTGERRRTLLVVEVMTGERRGTGVLVVGVTTGERRRTLLVVEVMTGERRGTGVLVVGVTTGERRRTLLVVGVTVEERRGTLLVVEVTTGERRGTGVLVVGVTTGERRRTLLVVGVTVEERRGTGVLVVGVTTGERRRTLLVVGVTVEERRRTLLVVGVTVEERKGTGVLVVGVMTGERKGTGVLVVASARRSTKEDDSGAKRSTTDCETPSLEPSHSSEPAERFHGNRGSPSSYPTGRRGGGM